MDKISVMPPFGLPRLMAVYCVWEEDRRGGGRALVHFQPAARRRPAARGEVLITEGATAEILRRAREEPRIRFRELLNYCLTVAPPYPPGSLGGAIERLRTKFNNPQDERLWLAFVAVANRVVSGERYLLHRGADVVLAQYPDFRLRLFPAITSPAGTTLQQTGRYFVAAVSGSPNGLTANLLRQTPIAAVIAKDQASQRASVQLRVRPWRPPLNLNRLRTLLPAGEDWRLEHDQNRLACGHSRITLAELAAFFERAGQPH